MANPQELFEDLQAELQETGQSLGELLREAVENPGSAPDVAVELTDSDLLLVDLDDEDLRLDLDQDLLLVDPADEEFGDLLRAMDVFGIGEELGFVPSDDE